jgi:hypothetical protein
VSVFRPQFAEEKLAQADARMTSLAKQGKTHFADDFLVCFGATLLLLRLLCV